MSDKVRVICKFPHGITLQRLDHSAPTRAFDCATGIDGIGPKLTHFHLDAGENIVDLSRLEPWMNTDGLRVKKTDEGYIVSDGRPRDAADLIISRAMASDRIARAR
jgi:hypothetical protein